ncbi:MAG: hypothetical protein U0796_19685 [Gemmatales bacterium]
MTTTQSDSGRPSVVIKLVVSLFILFHLTAIICHVIAGGGPLVMKMAASYFRPYLKTMWLDNAYRFYAPDPGPTEVLWYKMVYEDGSTHWTQVPPRREDIYLRMPYQRHMSIALLASMMNEQEVIKPKEDPLSAVSILVSSQPSYRTVLTAWGEIHFRSYARHIARRYATHPTTQAKLAYTECYFVQYLIRTPAEMRLKMDMFDPRKLRIQFICCFTPTGQMANFEQGFKQRAADDLFVELTQNEIVPLLEANARKPAAERQSIMQILHDYGIPYPLVQPLAKLSNDSRDDSERSKFFAKPIDRDTLRERYKVLVKMGEPDDSNEPSVTTQPSPTKPATAEPLVEKAPRGIQ